MLTQYAYSEGAETMAGNSHNRFCSTYQVVKSNGNTPGLFFLLFILM